jgi:hypothetical protein
MCAFFENALSSDVRQRVVWSEVDKSVSVIAREIVDLSSSFRHKHASEELVLLNEGEALVLFVRHVSPEGETLTRTTLPVPFDAAWAEISPYRPAPVATFGLHLQPETRDGIIQIQSAKDANGNWKNTTSRGVPIYVTFESKDRESLSALRAKLLGSEGADRAQAKADRQSQFESLLGTLSPNQRTAALLQAALKMREEADRQFAAQFGGTTPPTPELASALSAMLGKLEQMSNQVLERSAGNPPDPETVRKIEEHLRGRDDG